MEILIEQLHSDKDPGNVRERFNEIQKEVIIIFTSKEDVVKENSYSHGLANMALLDVSQNAALSNSVFDVKRHRVINYDKEGRYIPICTNTYSSSTILKRVHRFSFGERQTEEIMPRPLMRKFHLTINRIITIPLYPT